MFLFFSSSLLAQVLVSQGGVDDGGAASVRAIMHWQYRTICRGQSSLLHNLYELLGPETHDYISFYGLRSHGQLINGGPVVTSQVCIDIMQFIASSIIFLPSL